MTNAQKAAARKKTRAAIQRGKLTRPDACAECEARGEVHAHHLDYARPLDVVWLCPDCHRAAHAGEQRGRGRPSLPPRSDEEVTALRDAERKYQRAFAHSETEREARNAAVLRALAAGWTHAQIAEATGLTRGRVGQIASGSNSGSKLSAHDRP